MITEAIRQPCTLPVRTALFPGTIFWLLVQLHQILHTYAEGMWEIEDKPSRNRLEASSESLTGRHEGTTLNEVGTTCTYTKGHRSGGAEGSASVLRTPALGLWDHPRKVPQEGARVAVDGRMRGKPAPMTENERRAQDVLTREDLVIRGFAVAGLIAMFLLMLLVAKP